MQGYHLLGHTNSRSRRSFLAFLNIFLSDLDTILQNTLHQNNLVDSSNE